MRRFSVLVTAVLLPVVTLPMLSCSVVGLDDDNDQESPPIRSEIEFEGVVFHMRSEIVQEEFVQGESVRLWVSATNVSDTTITREMNGSCFLPPVVAYREGFWRRPAWDRTQMPGGGGCGGLAAFIDLAPGETAIPDLWDQTFLVRWILGDSLEAGRYRMGSLDVPIGHDVGDVILATHVFAPKMVAAEPVRLERRASN